MECKNCQTTLKETAKFCDECGGKVIRHRLNFKTVITEFLENYISWDNKFFKTFTHLITKPHEVANGYLDGVRKRYMQPFAYLLVMFSIYGIYSYLSKDLMIDYSETINKILPQSSSSKQNPFNFVSLMIFMNNNDKAITLALIPILAYINKLIFKKRNFIEHIILLLYLFGTVTFIMSITGFIGIIFNISYGFINNLNQLLLIVCSMYFYKKLFKLDIWELLLKTIYFWLLLIPFYILTVMIIIILKFHLITF